MGKNLFSADIAGKINAALGSKLLAATLIKVTPGTRDPSNLSAGTAPTTANYAARGVVSDYTDREIDGTLVQADDRKVLLLGDSIASAQVPETGDRVTIEGATYDIMRVMRDPEAASYTLQVRS